MKVQTKQRVCSALLKDLSKGRISLTHKLQRKEVWSTKQKAMLIDSILKGYRFYPIFMAEDKETKRLDVIDGVQRIATIRDFVEDRFRLSRNAQVTTYTYVDKEDGSTVVYPEVHDVGGKKFSKLGEELQEMILDYELTIMVATDYTDAEIREMFSRLNNGSPLNNMQKNVVDYTYDFKEKLDACLGNEFWMKTGITPADIKKEKNREVLLQCLYAISGEDVAGFRNTNIHAFAKHLQTLNYVKYLSSIYDILEIFNDVFDEKVQKFNKLSIAPVFAGTNEFIVMENDLFREYNMDRLSSYAKRIKNFFSSEYDDSEYAQHLKDMGGTADKDNVKYRIDFFTKMAKETK